MSAENKLVVEKRTKTGSAESRRLRRQGLIPGNFYGHGRGAIAITCSVDQVNALIESGHRVVNVDLEGETETAMFREVQWDTFSTHVQHFDLQRVDANERVTVDVPIELKGNSPGVMAGGMLETPTRTITLECPAISIPDQIVVRINKLDIDGVIHVSDITLPANATLHTPEDAVVAHVVSAASLEAAAEAELEDEAASSVEPEIIGRKEKEDGADD